MLTREARANVGLWFKIPWEWVFAKSAVLIRKGLTDAIRFCVSELLTVSSAWRSLIWVLDSGDPKARDTRQQLRARQKTAHFNKFMAEAKLSIWVLIISWHSAPQPLSNGGRVCSLCLVQESASWYHNINVEEIGILCQIMRCLCWGAEWMIISWRVAHCLV